jgi:hypothetical protein
VHDREPIGRTVSLVVSHHGDAAGVLPRFEVETPWWQDVEPISSRFDDLAVLRVLDVDAPPGSFSGGHVTYLVESTSPQRSTFDGPLEAWDGTLTDDPRRMPWAKPGGPASDLMWASAQLPSVGTWVQHRTWNLSAIWSNSSGASTSWLKCVPSFFSHEAAILELLSDQPVPRPIGVAEHRLLLEGLDGRDGYDASLKERLALIDVLVELQLATTERVDDLLAHGVPDRRFAPLLSSIADVVTRRAADSPVLGRFMATADQRIAEIEACGLPVVLVHGDAHAGNARIGPGTGSGIWFDWGDATIGHPVLDLGVLDRPATPFRDQVLAYWLDAWKQAVPRSDPHRAWQLARPLATLVGAVVYQGFLDRIEPNERVYHEADVPLCLARAEQLLVDSAQGAGPDDTRSSTSS